jgi:hypothetical protein
MNRPEGSGLRVYAAKPARKRRNVWNMDEVRARSEEVGNCLLWGQSVNSGGAPSASFDGKTMTVRRLVYVELMGKKLQPGRQLTVRCHNSLCVSEHCIIQRPKSDILRDARQRRIAADPMAIRREQRAATKAKLSPEIAAEIRASEEPATEIAKRLGVHPESIHAILRGDHYAQPKVAATSVFGWAAMLGAA